MRHRYSPPAYAEKSDTAGSGGAPAPAHLVRDADRPLFPEPAAMRLDEGVEPLADSLARAERKALLAALVACGGNRRLAASRLGISRAGLYAKLQQHGIER